MTTPDIGRLTNPDRWRQALPESLFHSFQTWIEGQGFDLTHQRWLTGGRSGCHVAAVTLTPECGKAHGAVLKLFPPELAARESRGVSLARQHSPLEFYKTHMVDTTEIDPLPNSPWWLHLQAMAHADLARILPLADLVDDPRFPHYCELVASTITDSWNEGKPDPTPFDTTLSRFLTKALAERMDQLDEFAKAARLNLKQPQPRMCLPGRHDALPNPLATLNATMGTHDHVTVYTGNGHGDLHLRNVLMLPDADTFRMIDYGRFSPEMPVSRDPVKLVLSIMERWLPDLAPGSGIRTRLADLTVRPHTTVASAAVSGYFDVIKRIFGAASTWGTRRDLTQVWTRQHLLILASSALRTVARDDIDMPDRWWFFEVAALAIADLSSGEDTPDCQARWVDRSLTDLKDPGEDPLERWIHLLTHPTS